MRHNKKSLVCTSFVFFFFVFCSCVQAKESYWQSKYGDNSYYFLGLRAKDEGNLNEAKNYFEKCIKKGNGLAARRSLEELCLQDDAQKRISNAKKLVELYDDEDALLFATRIFSEYNEPNLIISITNKIDLKKSSNELIQLRFEARKKRGDNEFIDDLYDWIFFRPMNSEQYDFFRDNFSVGMFDSEKTEFENLLEKKIYLMNFRAEVYKRNYGVARNWLPVIQKIIDESPEQMSLMTEQLMSDIGKACLYGSGNSLKSAQYLQSEAPKYKGTPVEFYCHFYAGRLYEKAGGYNAQMAKSFVSAVGSVNALLFEAENGAPIRIGDLDAVRETETEQNVIQNDEILRFLQLRDNALWYLFRTSLKTSISSSITYIERFVTQISDSYYYDDFFDLLSPLLLSEGHYKEFGQLYKLMDGHASDESTAKYAYIYARLLEEGIYLPAGADLADELPADEFIETEIQCAYNTALNSATDMYYKVMAAEKLGLPDFEREKLFCESRKLRKPATNTGSSNKNRLSSNTGTSGTGDATAIIAGNSGVDFDSEAEQLLNGYAFFGFPEKIYPEWIRLGSPVLSNETIISLCKFLNSCSTGEDDFLVQSLRIASKTANYSKVPLTLELLEYVYPKNYEEFVSKYCEKYGIQKSVLWALIRSESFFDPDVKSSAGAIGLCQFMPLTGEDIARRLKKNDYDLTDPETSIEFGAYYLDNLIGRLDGSYLDAFFSYNAGITRVRKWKKSSALGFGVKEIPEDLFLETLPYAETREYGRKLVAATEMYEWLYYRH